LKIFILAPGNAIFSQGQGLFLFCLTTHALFTMGRIFFHYSPLDLQQYEQRDSNRSDRRENIKYAREIAPIISHYISDQQHYESFREIAEKTKKNKCFERHLYQSGQDTDYGTKISGKPRYENIDCRVGSQFFLEISKETDSIYPEFFNYYFAVFSGNAIVSAISKYVA